MLPQPSTHDWTVPVDRAHLDLIRADPECHAPGGAAHLLLEVLAYPADEAVVIGGGRCRVTLTAEGFIVADEGRGTATVRGDDGRVLRKPVMSTADLRFFAVEPPALLPDGLPRRGMSVVAALSPRLDHTNRRTEGGWTQSYRFGVPADELTELPGSGRTGTTVEVRLDPALGPLPDVDTLRSWTRAWPLLTVEIDGGEPVPTGVRSPG